MGSAQGRRIQPDYPGQSANEGGRNGRIGIGRPKNAPIRGPEAMQMQAEGRFHLRARPGNIQKQAVGVRSRHGQPLPPGESGDGGIVFRGRAKTLGELCGREKLPLERVARRVQTPQQIVQLGLIAPRQGQGQFHLLTRRDPAQQTGMLQGRLRHMACQPGGQRRGLSGRSGQAKTDGANCQQKGRESASAQKRGEVHGV